MAAPLPHPPRPVRFGTDGLRGKAGEPPLDADTIRCVGAALGLWLETQGQPEKRVLLGNDGRSSAEWILQSLEQGLAAAEAQATDLGLCTTPALASVARREGCAAAVMVSASHNPASDNGIKIFGKGGRKLPDAAEREIERLAATVVPEHLRRSRSRLRTDLLDRYVEHLGNRFAHLDLSGRKIVVDGANGGGSRLVPRILQALGAEVVAIACAPDGQNINADCGALHPQALAARVVAEHAHFGIALDGDGDRGIFVDERGQVHDGDAVLAALGPALARSGRLPHATVVATVMSNLGLGKALTAAGLRLELTPVGDRHVVQRMQDGGYGLGGEQSGHIVFAGPGEHTGDGLYTALELLALERQQGRGFAALFAPFQRFPQLLVNVPVGAKPDLATLAPVQAAVRAVEAQLGSEGRVVLRYSGTENLCRVMVEGPTDELVRQHAETIAAAVRAALPA